MPHLQLEYSENIQLPGELISLFSQLHRILSETGGIALENCKSRARIASPFLVGSGKAGSAFMHLDIRFLDGRSSEVKQAVGEAALELIERWFQNAINELEIQITVEVRDIERSFYFKYPAGMFTDM